MGNKRKREKNAKNVKKERQESHAILGKIHSFIDAFSSKTKAIASIISFILLFIPIVNIVSEYIYKTKCEKQYGIPARYFSVSLNNILVYLVLTFLLFFIAFLPFIKHFFETKHNISTNRSMISNIMLSIILGGTIGVLNVFYIIDILKTWGTPHILASFINSMDTWLFIFIVIFLFVGWVLALFFIHKIESIKSKALVLLIVILFLVLSVINGLIILGGMYTRIASNYPENKTKYENIEKNKEKYIVLSEYNNKKLVVKYTTKLQNDYLQYELLTDNYYFVDDSDYSYSYIDTKYPPIVRSHQ